MDEFDVVVVGSGAAGMTAAITAAEQGLRAVVIEKADHYGGSTVRSGGGVWIPNNDALRASGITDDDDAPATYLKHIVGEPNPSASAARQQAFLDAGPAMLAMVTGRTPLRFAWVPNYCDYYPEAPGGRPSGRSVEPKPLNARLLGEHRATLGKPYVPTPKSMVLTQADYRWLNLVLRHPRGPVTAAKVAILAIIARMRRQEPLTMGLALTAGLRIGLAKLGVEVRLSTPMSGLATESGRVVGVDTPDGRITARRGVILASGGFEHSETLRREHQRAPIGTQWTVGAAENTGDGLEQGRALGAAVDLLDDAWWGPSIPLSGGPYFCLSERTLPGCLLVNGEGKRFVNESAPYVDAVHAMYGEGSGPARNMPTWLIADQRYRNRYLFAGLGPRQPFPRRWYEAGAVVKAGSIASLSEKIDLPVEALAATIDRFNGFARGGDDEDFGRGESTYDRYYGDPRNKPNPCLAELAVAPFYAVKIVPGDLGTKGGLRTDTHGRVLRENDEIIEGLYAAGNVSGAVMGHTYAGPGATIGPAMTFGYLAARHIAAHTAKTHPAADMKGRN
jgi:3-oxosteroid 1-dehydrogenase